MKVQIKVIGTDNHLQCLTRCKNEDMVPRTLRIRLQPQILDTNAEFLIKWEEAYVQFGRSLVDLLRQYWEN